jgi:enolase
MRWMIPLFNGGKAAGSAVKFSKFYLVVDPSLGSAETINATLKQFQINLRKQMASVKGGEAAFKADQGDTMFNAYSSINECFKQIEDALAAAAPKGTEKPQTAESGKLSQMSNATLKPIKIGINCDANTLFNKDPKEPNKYEVDGAKGQSTSQQLQEYYLKLIQDHPLLCYLEDAFADADAEGFRTFKRMLARKAPYVQLGVQVKSIEQLQQATQFEELD